MVQGVITIHVHIQYLVGMLDTYDNSLKKATLTALVCTAEDSGIYCCVVGDWGWGDVDPFNYTEKNKKHIIELGADRLIAKIIMKEPNPDSVVAAAAQAIAALAKEQRR